MSEARTTFGRRIFYDDIGSGTPILLIPGQSGDRRGCLTWWATALARHLRVVSMDNRDAGESDPEPDYYTLADLAGDAAALLDALGIARAHVLGHSLGGKIALQFALDHPARLDRLVIVSASANGRPRHQPGQPIPPPDEWWTDDPVDRFRRLVPGIVGPDYLARLDEAQLAALAEPERANKATWAGAIRQEASLGRGDLQARLGELRASTLVMLGADDPLLPRERGESLAKDIPGARLLVLPGVGHIPWVERPDEVNRAILDFLAEPPA
jgi:pimeloyl-ACP methyl ester carboxylesterase